MSRSMYSWAHCVDIYGKVAMFTLCGVRYHCALSSLQRIGQCTQNTWVVFVYPPLQCNTDSKWDSLYICWLGSRRKSHKVLDLNVRGPKRCGVWILRAGQGWGGASVRYRKCCIRLLRVALGRIGVVSGYWERWGRGEVQVQEVLYKIAGRVVSEYQERQRWGEKMTLYH